MRRDPLDLGFVEHRYETEHWQPSQDYPQVTTHVMRREGDRVIIENDPQAVQGWRIDQILTSELFGLPSARPPQVERLIEQRRAILGKSVITEEDRARLRELDAELAELPYGETAEDADALATIRRYAAELRERRGTGS